MLSSRRLFSSTAPSSSSFQSHVFPSSFKPASSPSSRKEPILLNSPLAARRAPASPASLSAAPSTAPLRLLPRLFRFPAAARGGCVCRVRLNCAYSLLDWPSTTRDFPRRGSACKRLCTYISSSVGSVNAARPAVKQPAASVASVAAKSSFSTAATTACPPLVRTFSTSSSGRSSSSKSIKMAAAPAPNGGAPASSVGSPISSAASPSGMSVAGSSSGPVSRRFAPLDPAKARLLVGQENVRWVRGVVFDVDGTLCQPQNYMFAEMRAALSIPPQIDILEHIYSLPPPQQPHAMAAIRSIERRAMAVQQPQPGLVPLMDYLESRMLRKAICTRNFDAPVLHLLESFLPGHSFDPIVTRDFRPPKPHPAGILSIAKAWGCLEGPVAGAVPTPHMPPPLGEGQAVVPPPPLAPLTPPDLASAAGSPGGSSVAGIEGEAAVIAGSAPSLIMVGDSLDDMVAGRRAGAATVLLLNESNMHLARREETDLVIRRLDDLIVVLENGFVGQHGT